MVGPDLVDLNENSSSQSYTTFPQKSLKNTNHRHISLTGTVQCNSKRSNKIHFEEDIHLFFPYSISENLPESQKPKGIFWKDWAFHFKKKYFEFPKRFVNSSGDIWLGQFTGEGKWQFTCGNSASTVVRNKKLFWKKS